VAQARGGYIVAEHEVSRIFAIQKGITRDMTSIGHYGNGDCRGCPFKDLDETAYVIV